MFKSRVIRGKTGQQAAAARKAFLSSLDEEEEEERKKSHEDELSAAKSVVMSSGDVDEEEEEEEEVAFVDEDKESEKVELGGEHKDISTSSASLPSTVFVDETMDFKTRLKNKIAAATKEAERRKMEEIVLEVQRRTEQEEEEEEEEDDNGIEKKKGVGKMNAKKRVFLVSAKEEFLSDFVPLNGSRSRVLQKRSWEGFTLSERKTPLNTSTKSNGLGGHHGNYEKGEADDEEGDEWEEQMMRRGMRLMSSEEGEEGMLLSARQKLKDLKASSVSSSDADLHSSASNKKLSSSSSALKMEDFQLSLAEATDSLREMVHMNRRRRENVNADLSSCAVEEQQLRQSLESKIEVVNTTQVLSLSYCKQHLHYSL